MMRAAMHAGITDERTNEREEGKRRKGETWMYEDERETTKEECGKQRDEDEAYYR